MRRLFILALVIVGGGIALVWAHGLSMAIQRGDIASFSDYMKIQSYSLSSGSGPALSTAELQLEPALAEDLIATIRNYAAERNMVVAVGPRSERFRLININIWGGKSFRIAIFNPNDEEQFLVSFFDYHDEDDWRGRRDDFLMFLRATFGDASVREIG